MTARAASASRSSRRSRPRLPPPAVRAGCPEKCRKRARAGGCDRPVIGAPARCAAHLQLNPAIVRLMQSLATSWTSWNRSNRSLHSRRPAVELPDFAQLGDQRHDAGARLLCLVDHLALPSLTCAADAAAASAGSRPRPTPACGARARRAKAAARTPARRRCVVGHFRSSVTRRGPSIVPTFGNLHRRRRRPRGPASGSGLVQAPIGRWLDRKTSALRRAVRRVPTAYNGCMLIKRPSDIRSSEITDQKLYVNRREFIQAAGAAAGAAMVAGADSVLQAAASRLRTGASWRTSRRAR